MRTRRTLALLIGMAVLINSASAVADVKAAEVKVAEVKVADVKVSEKSRPSPSSFRRTLQANQTTATNSPTLIMGGTQRPTNEFGLPAIPTFFPTIGPKTTSYLGLSRSDFIQACIIGGSVLLGLALFLSQWNRYKRRGKRSRFAPARNRGGPIGGPIGGDSGPNNGGGPGPPNKVFIDNGGGNGEYDSRSTNEEEDDYFDAGSGGSPNGGFSNNNDPIRRTAADTGIQSMLAAKAKSVNNRTTQSGSDQRFTVGRARSQWKSRAATQDHAGGGGGEVNPEMADDRSSRGSMREAVDSVFSRLHFPSARMVYQSTLGAAKAGRQDGTLGSGDKGMAPDRSSYMPRQTTSRTSVGGAATSGYQQSLQKKKASMAPPKTDVGRVVRNDWRRSDAPSAMMNTPRRTHNGRYKTRARTVQGGNSPNRNRPTSL